jgi:hypothetical protein
VLSILVDLQRVPLDDTNAPHDPATATEIVSSD